MLGASLLAGCREKPMVNATPANLLAAIAQAKAENKLLLLEFGSSDSCAPCMKLEEKVFSQPEFKDYAATNLVFLRIDFPDRHKLPPSVEATNLLLGTQFEILPFPSFVALDRDGKEFWRFPAKDDANPKTPAGFSSPQGFIAWIEEVRLKLK